MAVTGLDPFPRSALEANRAGQLTPAQGDRLRPIARSARQAMLGAAVMFAVATAMMLDSRAVPLPALFRVGLAGACVMLALVFLVRAAIGADAISRDLREPKVQQVDGAIGKRWKYISSRTRSRSYWLDVGDGAYRVSRAGYLAAPDAGIVRVYFLPRSRRVVNLERLPEAPTAAPISPRDVLTSLGAAVLSGRRRELNDLRARLAPMMNAVDAAREEAVPPAPDVRDARPLDEAIVGTWTSPLMTVAFEPDGTVTATLFDGMERHGRWSVDGAGRLIADVTGHREAADAWVAGNELTISADGKPLRLTRR